MKLLPRLVIFLIICLIAIALPTAPAQAIQCYIPFIDLYPDSGTPGTEVTVKGQRFYEDAFVEIYFDGDRVATGRTDENEKCTITFIVPESCKGVHQVYAEVLDEIAEANFSVKPGLTVSPEKGPASTTVTVEGQGFTQEEEGIELLYYLNGSYETIEGNITANDRGSWDIDFQIPLSGKGEHKLDAQSAESDLYEVENAIFKVTPGLSIEKSSGIVGESIMMTGIEFAVNEKNINILFDGEAVVTDIKADAQGDWEESFDVPEMPRGEYTVTAEGEWTPREDITELSFEIEPGIVLSPEEGHVGETVTATGHGFAVNENVDIMYDNSRIATAKAEDKGSFNVSFPVPESKYGENQVTAEDAEGNETEQPAIFTMESDPPDTPKLVSPPDGSRVGVIGRVRPTFEWSEVSDDSGVYYRLKIATTADVTSSAGIVLVTGLTQPNCTLDRTLSYGTYYWSVQAVDGAENESGWTAARSFRAGLMPLWAFIVVITAVAVGIILLVRFLLRRRGIFY
jgi:hypothetical protein